MCLSGSLSATDLYDFAEYAFDMEIVSIQIMFHSNHFVVIGNQYFLG
jgi:hypothetical protein